MAILQQMQSEFFYRTCFVSNLILAKYIWKIETVNVIYLFQFIAFSYFLKMIISYNVLININWLVCKQFNICMVIHALEGTVGLYYPWDTAGKDIFPSCHRIHWPGSRLYTLTPDTASCSEILSDIHIYTWYTYK